MNRDIHKCSTLTIRNASICSMKLVRPMAGQIYIVKCSMITRRMQTKIKIKITRTTISPMMIKMITYIT